MTVVLVKSSTMNLPVITTPQTAPQPDALLILTQENAQLRDQILELQTRIAWFEKQLFGSKSEKRIIDNPYQPSLLTEPTLTLPEPVTVTVPAYERGAAKKQRPEDCVTDTGLRFGPEVPVQVVRVEPPELTGPDADQYRIINIEVSHKLAQPNNGYSVIRYEKVMVQRKGDKELITPAMPPQVLDNSIADVSLLAGLLVDKFLYHLPLYRQHQRMTQMGITVSRASLTHWVKRAIELLRPIVEAQTRHVLLSSVLAMDETPIKAGLKHPGKMKQGYIWPIYGEDDEVIFTYSDSRGRQHIENVLKNQFQGVLITDGYAAYARYAEKTQGIVHAQCWVHSRRHLVAAREQDSAACDYALNLIGQLYQVETQIEQQRLAGEKKHQYRREHSKPIVDTFFAWCWQQLNRSELTPKNPLRKALNYIVTRETELRVFLEDPDIPLDTNHLERAIRPIPMGRKNWMFCWTELGAEHTGLIQSLISTCKLHGVNPVDYLIDVLQRISVHPASRVNELTPRLWKNLFASSPMRSVIHAGVKIGAE